MPSIWDLVVIGSGPAGAAAALEARRLRPDASVLLVDKAAFPRDKACGDGLGPHAVDELAAVGAGGVLAGYPPIRGLRLRSPRGLEVAGDPARPNYVVPRAVLDARLVEAALAAGAGFRRARVRGLEQRDGLVVVDGELAARVVVGADGANSTVRRLLGAPPNPDRALAIAVRGYAPAPAGRPEQLIAWVAEGWPAYVWSFPTGTGVANVGYGLLRSRFHGDGAELRRRLHALLPQADPDPASLRAHHLPFSSFRPPGGRGRVLLAGDAASLVNPLSGEGIYYALASGRLAARAALTAPRDPVAAYRRLLADALGRHLRHAAVLARAIRSPALAEAGLGAAAGSPALFDTLVELGLGQARITPRLVASLPAGMLLAHRARHRARHGRPGSGGGGLPPE
ncbi:MAG TPA: geranylgeranyl reductase family protein [Actinomycetes bacterium]|nr:geranylgeranyl reductase family protein [Actinomycetes bacterium]